LRPRICLFCTMPMGMLAKASLPCMHHRRLCQFFVLYRIRGLLPGKLTFINSIKQTRIMEKEILASVALACCCAGASAQTVPADSTQTAPAASDSIYRQMELGGVTVEGRTAIQKGDYTAYMPTQRQVDAANSGIGLLANMMIPKLTVDRVSGTVKNANNTAPTIYIDNRKADAMEADRLRPKDIVRVEYYDQPSDEFPGEQSVLNFITRKYGRGGYVDVRTSTTFHPGLNVGGYSAQVGFDMNKMNITLLAGTDFDREDAVGTSGTEHYAFDAPFTKQTTATYGLTKQRNYYGKMRMTYRTDKTTAYSDIGLGWGETPTDRHSTLVVYSPQAYPDAMATTTTQSRNATPQATLFMETRPGKGQTLRVQANYAYGNNTYRRDYTEGGLTPVITDTKEIRNNFDAHVKYTADLRHNNSVTLFIWGFNTWSKADYIGTIDAGQEIQDGGLQLLPMYTHTFAKKLRIGIQPGLYWERYYIKGIGATRKIQGRPTISTSYSINSKNSLYANWSMGTSVPTMDLYNNTEQRVNQYTIKRGNPNLEIEKLHFVDIGYSLALKNVNLSLFGDYFIAADLTKDFYTTEGETMVSTYMSDGALHSCIAGGAVAWSLLNRSLQLSGQLMYKGQRLTGVYSAHNDRMLFSLSTNYYIKNFTLTAMYSSKMSELSGSQWNETPAQYYFTASWHHKGLYAEIGCQRIFDKDYKKRQWFDFGTYSYDRATVYNNMCSAWLKISYSFDFGRKKVERTELEVDRGSSGIMKM